MGDGVKQVSHCRAAISPISSLWTIDISYFLQKNIHMNLQFLFANKF